MMQLLFEWGCHQEVYSLITRIYVTFHVSLSVGMETTSTSKCISN